MSSQTRRCFSICPEPLSEFLRFLRFFPPFPPRFRFCFCFRLADSIMVIIMSTFGFIEYENAGPEVRAVYDDIKATRKPDTITNFWKAIAHDPLTLKLTWESTKKIMAQGVLDPVMKELIYVAVSASNQCDYCIAAHTA